MTYRRRSVRTGYWAKRAGARLTAAAIMAACLFGPAVAQAQNDRMTPIAIPARRSASNDASDVWASKKRTTQGAPPSASSIASARSPLS